MVLSTAYVLKEQVLETIEQRHPDERAFQVVLADWQAATADPEQHTNWSQMYANALRDALLKANSRRKEALGSMTVDDWRLVVHRETQADRWYEEPNQVVIPVVATSSNKNVLPVGRNGHSPKATIVVG